MGAKKYYVIWKGKETGVFSSWDKVKKLVQGVEGAKYKSFGSKAEANIAIKKKYSDYQGHKSKKIALSDASNHHSRCYYPSYRVNCSANYWCTIRR